VDGARNRTLVGAAEAAAWFADLGARGASERTSAVYRNGLDSLRLCLGGRKVARLTDVGADDLEAWRGELVREKKAPGTVDVYLRAARGWLGWLEKSGLLFINPAAAMTLPKVARRLLPVPTPGQMARILAGPNPATNFGVRDRAILEAAYATGARREELVRLDATDVALEAGTLRVTGKGRKERVLPLTKAAVRWLGRYTQHTRPKLLKGKLDEPALWIDLHGGRLASPALDAVVKKCARKARLRRITVHTLRRACATHLLQNGAHPFFVKELLGHATMKHLAHYLRLSIADVKAMHRQSRLGR